jgi:hypothetical protein
MNKITICLLFFFSFSLSAQDSFDSELSQEQMVKDLELFREIREIANSGLYKYRTKNQIDSIYNWAYSQIIQSSSLGDFYNIVCTITDFEGSLHNNTGLPDKVIESILNESWGYFPFMISDVEDYWVCNNDSLDIPVGSRIIEINGKKMEEIIQELGIYWTTDGYNTTGKKIGFKESFPFYYRLFYGQKESFDILYQEPDGATQQLNLQSISNKQYKENRSKMHSMPSDYLYFWNYLEMTEKKELYQLSAINPNTVLLKINSFYIGRNEDDPIHKKYMAFLDSTFSELKANGVENLIVDVRYNGGGTGPNDVETGSFLIDKPLKEVQQAWTSCRKLPKTKHLNIKWYQKPFANIVVKKVVKKNLSEGEDGNFYYDKPKTISPKENAFTGTLYLLVGPETASAASLFAAMVAGNTDAIVVGEETSGGYYGHNGIFPVSYVLPHSKIEFDFSLVNIDQNVPVTENQPAGSGIMPDYEVTTSLSDFLNNEDTTMKFVLGLIDEQ